jgi:acetyl esterase/lipase
MIAPDRAVPPPEPDVAAVVALNPVVDLLAYSPKEQQTWRTRSPALRWEGSASTRRPSLYGPGIPPVLIQHGTRDTIGSIGTMRRFRDLMAQAGNDCVLLEYEGAEHAFHYFAEHLDTVNNATADFPLGRLANHSRSEPLGQVLGEELPRYSEALRRLGESSA